jgi:hypothetical protein
LKKWEDPKVRDMKTANAADCTNGTSPGTDQNCATGFSADTGSCATGDLPQFGCYSGSNAPSGYPCDEGAIAGASCQSGTTAGTWCSVGSTPEE